MTETTSIGTRDGLVRMLGVLDRMEPGRPALSAADRLRCVTLARKLADRITALTAVLVAEADATGASEQETGSAMTSWLTLDATASKREAAGVLKQGRALVALAVRGEHAPVDGRPLAGAAAYLVLIGLLALALAVLLRSQLPPLVAMLGLVLVLSPLLSGLTEHARWLPDRAGSLLYQPGADTVLTPAAGALVLLCWTAATGAAAAAAFLARDA